MQLFRLLYANVVCWYTFIIITRRVGVALLYPKIHGQGNDIDMGLCCQKKACDS